MDRLVKFFLYFLPLFSFPPLFSNESVQSPSASLIEVQLSLGDDEVKIVDQLIESTIKQLDMEKHLKTLMIQFKDQKELFVQGDQTKGHAGQMIRTARQIYEIISANHIEHLFPKDYLEELTFFSSIAGKNKISKP